MSAEGTKRRSDEGIQHNAGIPRSPFVASSLRRSVASALVLVVFVTSGCGPTKNEIRAESGVDAYFAGDYRGAIRRLRPLAEKTDENFVLNNCRLGSAALAYYDLDEAEAAFLKAYEVINSV